MPRSVLAICNELATYAPRGGGAWQTVGMRQVPVKLLTELKEAMDAASKDD